MRLPTDECVTKSLWDKQVFSKLPIAQKSYNRVFPQAESENSFFQSYFEIASCVKPILHFTHIRAILDERI